MILFYYLIKVSLIATVAHGKYGQYISIYYAFDFGCYSLVINSE